MVAYCLSCPDEVIACCQVKTALDVLVLVQIRVLTRGAYLFTVPVESRDGDAQMMGGSLATPWDQVGVDRLEALLDKSTKDATLLLRKWLHEALRQEKLPVPGKARLGAMTPGELASLRTALSSKPDMAIRHLGLLQVFISQSCVESIRNHRTHCQELMRRMGSVADCHCRL